MYALSFDMSIADLKEHTARYTTMRTTRFASYWSRMDLSGYRVVHISLAAII